MKKILMVVAMLLLVLLLLPQIALAKDMEAKEESNAKIETGERGVSVRVATYNIAAGRGTDGSYDLNRIAESIRDLDADIIGLQEVDVHWGNRSENDHMIEQLAVQLDMYYYFAPIYDMDSVNEGDPRRQYGVGVLSKYPITEAANREIARLSTQDPNPVPSPAPGFLQAKINIAGADVWFYVTHLDYRGDPTVRQMQVQDMKEIMGEHTYSILVGDMNALPNAPELQPLFHDFNDAWDVNQHNPGYTFPASAPDRRIDYVLTSPRMETVAAEVHATNASDHLPVLADIKVIPGSNSYSIEGMEWLVDFFERRGDFADEEASNILTKHLNVLSYYEKQEKADKLIKHLHGFIELVDYQKEMEWISEDAWAELREDAEYFIEVW